VPTLLFADLDDEEVVMGPVETIRDLAEPSLAAAGLELWDVEVAADVVRVLVDRPGGVDLDVLTAASAILSPLFDEHPELLPGDTYQLEVSSPGIERNLRTPDQYRRYVGQTVSIKTSEPVAGSRRLRGVLTAVDGTGLEIALEDAAAGSPAIPVPFTHIQRTRTVLAWGPTPKSKPTPKPTRAAAPPYSPSGKDAT
jgi:ribosome maturation factor RimP